MTARRAGQALLLGALMLDGCGKKPGPEEAAKAFFDRLAAGKVDAAYDAAAFGFQVQTPRGFFAETVKNLAFTDMTLITFGPPQRDGNTATVRGDLTTKAGGTLSLIVTLTLDAGTWRVYAIKSPRPTGVAQDLFRFVGRASSLADAANRQPAPDDDAIRKLIVDAMTRFGDAIQTHSFDSFFDYVSYRWQLQLVHGDEPGFDYETAMRRPLKAGEREVGSAHFVRAFRAFFEHPADLSGLADVAPVLAEPPYVTTDGLLVVSGYFPAQPYRVNFALKFIYESPAWRIFAFDTKFEVPAAATR